MSYTKTTWADRISDGNKYTITDNGDGTKKIEYAGTVIRQGTPMNASNLNKIENELEALDTGKVDKVSGMGLSSNDYTTAEKQKLSGLKAPIAGTGIEIEEDGTINCTATTEVDSALSDSSENPVKNKVITAEINALKALRLPVQEGTLTYTGSVQSAAWDGYDSDKMTRGGTESGTNTGTYNATFTPISPYKWSDNTSSAKNASWSITKATGTLDLSSTSVSTIMNKSKTVMLTTNSDGAVSVSSSNTNRVTASVSGKTITVTGGTEEGAATLTVTVAGTANYTSASKTISVTNKLYMIMTIEIDQSIEDPVLRCTYKDDAVEMTAGSDAWDSFFGHYPCTLKNGVEGVRLNPNNYNVDINCNIVDITDISTGDVMVCFPRLGLRISTSDNIVTVSMTDNPNDPNFEYNAHTKGSTSVDKFYMGAYLGKVINSGFYSLSGKNPDQNRTLNDFRTYAHGRGTGYELAGFYQLIFMQCAYLLKFKSTDSQSAVCMGYVKSSHSAAKYTGGANNYGMDCGNLTASQKADKDHQSKCLGIEDLWGNLNWWIEGIFYGANGSILTANSDFNDTGSGYTDSGQIPADIIDGYIKKVQGSTKTGFIINEAGASSATHYCDNGVLSLRSYNQTIQVGGYYTQELDAGIFSHNVTIPNSHQGIRGARLMYY